MHTAVRGFPSMPQKNTSSVGALSRVRSTLLLALPVLVLGWSVPSASAQSFYVSAGSKIDKVSAAGVVSTFVDLGSVANGSNSSEQGLAVDLLGNLYSVDLLTGIVSKITSAGVASTFSTVAPGSNPVGLAIDSTGNVYVALSQLNEVVKILPTGLAAPGGPFAQLPAGSIPNGLAFDASGNLYTANLNADTISKIAIVGGLNTGVTTFATTSPFASPLGLTASGTNLYFADNNQGVIDKVASDGTDTVFATLPSTAQKRAYPYGVTTDTNGNLYVTDDGYNQVERITPGGVVSTFSGTITAPHFILMVPVPEPTAWAALLGGLGLLLGFQRFTRVR